MTPEAIITAIIAVTGALGLREWLPGIIQQITGRAREQREAVQAEAAAERAERAAMVDRLRDDADAADRRADGEACRRRLAYEHASQCRALLLGAGIEPPPWPDTSVCRDA